MLVLSIVVVFLQLKTDIFPGEADHELVASKTVVAKKPAAVTSSSPEPQQFSRTITVGCCKISDTYSAAGGSGTSTFLTNGNISAGSTGIPAAKPAGKAAAGGIL